MILSLSVWSLPIMNILGAMLAPDTRLNATLAPLMENQIPEFGQLVAIDIDTTSPVPDITKSRMEKRSTVAKALGFTAFATLAVVGIAGNGLVIFAIFTDSTVQTHTQVSNLAVLNLAYTDLMTTSIVCLPGAISMLCDEYPLGSIFCRIWSIFNLTGIVGTMGFLMVISLDRYIAVGYSLHYPTYVTHERLNRVCIFVWVYTFACTLGWGLFDCEYDFWAGVCDFTWQLFGPEVPSAFFYGLFCTIVVCLVPSLLILFANVMIIHMSKEKGRVGKVENKSFDGKPEKKESAKVNARILQAMVIVIVSYFALTFPVAIIRVVKVLSGPNGPAKYIPGWFTFFTTFLQFSASIVNPLIYGLFRKDFRDAFKKIWKRIRGD